MKILLITDDALTLCGLTRWLMIVVIARRGLNISQKYDRFDKREMGA
jgi:hypothetical protein